jgi:23S rRNA (pseudouridine1915-N3)-methyltransferase
MVIRLVAVGRMRDAALRTAGEEYAGRVGRSHRLEIREVRDAGRRAADAAAARRLEADALLAAVPGGARIFALTRRGRSYSSEDFAAQLDTWQRDARDVALVVGGAHGLGEAVLERAEGQISLSKMTLPHELARVVLLEQLYRAVTILRGEPYHKGNG